jgi:hypothetical protein
MERILFTSSHCTISELHALPSDEGRDELDTNPFSESKSNTLETNNSLKHDKISHQLYVEEESLYHKHDTENKPYEAFNVLSNQTATKLKPKVMPERYMDDTSILVCLLFEGCVYCIS